MSDENRLGEPGEKNPNEAMNEKGSTQGTEPGPAGPGDGTSGEFGGGAGDPGTTPVPAPAPGTGATGSTGA